jgi:hypothetical protein
VWSFDLEEYTGYSEGNLAEILKDIRYHCRDIMELIDYANNNFREGTCAE